MTASEKGKELIEKFARHAHGYDAGGFRGQLLENAKACALICVSEIIKSHENEDGSISDINIHGFWQSVRAYIEGYK